MNDEDCFFRLKGFFVGEADRKSPKRLVLDLVVVLKGGVLVLFGDLDRDLEGDLEGDLDRDLDGDLDGERSL